MLNTALKQPVLLLISLVASNVHFMESAQSQTAPPIKRQSIFAPYQAEPKFAPARENQTAPANAPANAQINAPTNVSGDKENNEQQLLPSSPQADSNNSQNNSPANQEPFTITPDGVPALNIVPAIERPPIPPPPDAAPLRPNGNGVTRPAQAWRVKAFQLFKQKLDPNTTIALVLNAEYNNALLALRQAIEDDGLSVTSVSSSSGHMLVCEPDAARSEKVIVAMRPALTEAKTKADAKTEMRVLCESRNKSLTTSRMKVILSKLQTKFGDIKTNAETL